MIKVKKLLEMKGSDIWSVGPDSSVFDAVKLMGEKNIGALAVMNDDGIVGIFSERDYTRRVFQLDRAPQDIMVKDVMTQDVLYAKPEERCEDVLCVMSKHDIRHMPVIDDEHTTLGMISIGDMAKEIIGQQKSQIHNLEHYVNWAERY
ncbi:MAG: CBS domain-containing protein [Gammaproteobacteria bacterium]|nr:CBS domain-containing protein [Gammaproteobacteria bacterium]